MGGRAEAEWVCGATADYRYLDVSVALQLRSAFNIGYITPAQDPTNDCRNLVKWHFIQSSKPSRPSRTTPLTPHH